MKVTLRYTIAIHMYRERDVASRNVRDWREEVMWNTVHVRVVEAVRDWLPTLVTVPPVPQYTCDFVDG